jgi:predicted Zn-dependent peptidase
MPHRLRSPAARGAVAARRGLGGRHRPASPRSAAEPGPRRARWLLAALLVAQAPGAAGAPAAPDPAARTRETRLSNGLVVLTLEDHATPVVSFQMWVKAGSRDERWYTGIAHLFEHMMFKGSKRVGPEEHARIVQARGGRVNAYTTRDQTVYHTDVSREHLPLVIELEAERVTNLAITQATLDGEREVVLEERRLRVDDQPDGRALETLLALSFVAHPYRWPVIGWRSDVEAATVEACRDFFGHYYVPNNIVLAIVGDFDAEEALRVVRRSFGRLPPAAEIPRNPTREPEQRGERRATVEFDLRSPVLAAAWHAPASGHADAEPLDVLSEILSAGRSSRLYRRLVYQEQLALAAEGAYWEMRDAGLFFAFASVRPDARIERVEQVLLEEIARLGERPVSGAELEKAKRQLEVGLVNGLATSRALASRIAYDVATFGRIRPLEERLSAIQAVDAEDVQRVARTYLAPDGRSVVRVVAPASGARAEGPPAPAGGARPASGRRPRSGG